MPTALLCAEAINNESPNICFLSSDYVVAILLEVPHRSLEVSKNAARVDFRGDTAQEKRIQLMIRSCSIMFDAFAVSIAEVNDETMLGMHVAERSRYLHLYYDLWDE
jgi:hypothetical protein